MKARKNFFYLALALGTLLAALTIQAYWPILRKEAAYITETWRAIRNAGDESRHESAESETPSGEAPGPNPRRSLQPPTPDLSDSGSASTPKKGGDDFISDVRARATEDPEAALLWLQEAHSGSDRLRGMLEVVALWAAKDAESALLWLESNAQGVVRMEALQDGVERWADRAPLATAAWVDGMANDGSKTAAARALARQWASSAPEQAATWVAELPEGEIATAASLALIDSWAETDPEAAALWALNQAEYRGNDQALEQSIQNYTKKNPSAAESFIQELSEAYDSPAPAATYARALAEEDPAAAAAWFSKLDPTNPVYSNDHARTILRTWAESDSIAASKWLSEQPNGPRRDAAIAGFAETIQRFEPGAATLWAETIESPELRMQQLEANFSSWAQQNPNDARSWLESAELAPALRAGLDSLFEN